MTIDEEVIAAAVLHDVVEDTPTTKEQLETEFGKKEAELVCADSENKSEDRPAAEMWEIRKQETLDHIPNYRDYLSIKDELWDKFNVK